MTREQRIRRACAALDNVVAELERDTPMQRHFAETVPGWTRRLRDMARWLEREGKERAA